MSHAKDPYGHKWGIATPKEGVTPDEMDRLAEKFAKSMADGPVGLRPSVFACCQPCE